MTDRIKPRPMPWKLSLLLAFGALVPVAIASQVVGESAIPATLAGAVLGLCGPMIGSLWRTGLGIAVLLTMVAARLAYPELDARLLIVPLALLAGWETSKTGGRTMPLTLMVSGLLWSAGQTGGSPLGHTVEFSLGAAWGLGLAIWLNLEKLPKLPPEGWRGGIRQALFLLVGLTLSITLVRNVENAHAIWVVQMFALRAFVPTHMAVPLALRYVSGVIVGAMLAYGLKVGFDLTHAYAIGISLVSLIIGLRILPFGPPWSSMAMTVAVLIPSASLQTDALHRGEAALVVTGLAIALSAVLDRLVGRKVTD